MPYVQILCFAWQLYEGIGSSPVLAATGFPVLERGKPCAPDPIVGTGLQLSDHRRARVPGGGGTGGKPYLILCFF